MASFRAWCEEDADNARVVQQHIDTDFVYDVLDDDKFPWSAGFVEILVYLGKRGAQSDIIDCFVSCWKRSGRAVVYGCENCKALFPDDCECEKTDFCSKCGALLCTDDECEENDSDGLCLECYTGALGVDV